VLLLAGIFLFGLPGSYLLAQMGADRLSPVEREMKYADMLAEMGMADYAQMVLDRIKDPQVKKFAQLQNRVNMGEFEKAQQMIDSQPDPDSLETWRMRLILGDGYYAWGKYEKARGVYEKFFEKHGSDPPESLEKFYLESAYKYAQMLLLMGRKKDAVDTFELMLGVIPKNDMERRPMRRQVLSETAEILVELAEKAEPSKRNAYFERIDEIATEVLWVQDLWFGKMIVTLAHVELIKGNTEEATSLIEDYRSQLIAIDKALEQQAKEMDENLNRFSPMAECRYLIGVMMHDKAKELLEEGGNRKQVVELLAGKKKNGKGRTSGALQHLLNVFIKYPGTRWAPEAGRRSEEIEKTLVEQFGARIKTNVTREQMARVRRHQFSSARALFNQNQFEKAAKRYTKVLNMYPEGDMSVPAVSDLAECYMELGNETYADTVIYYLAERFSSHPELMIKAGDEVLKLANKYETEKKMPEKKEAIYQSFFDLFEKHPRTPGLLFAHGDRKFNGGDIDGALRYYQRVAQRYENSPFYYEALSKIAHCYEKKEQHDKELEALDEYAEAIRQKEDPGQRLIYANYRLAYARQRKGGDSNLARAIKRYAKIQKLLKNNPDKYQRNSREEEANKRLLEGSLFNMARSFSMLKGAESKRELYKKQAVKTLKKLVEQYPDSEFAAPAYSQMGMLYTLLGRHEESEKALRTLREEYPETEEAKNAIFMQGKSLLELGMRDRAVEVFKEMFAPENRGRFSETQILTAGKELLQAEEYGIAVDAFDSVLATAGKPQRIQSALLGKGKALTELERYEEATEPLDKLLEEYPRSGRIIEACLYASRAYSERAVNEEDRSARLELFNTAVKRMKKVRQYTQAPAKLAQSDLGVAGIFKLKAEAEGKFGTEQRAEQYANDAIAAYQILIMTGNPGDPKVKPFVEQAYYECIPMMLEKGRWDDVIADCQKYISQFPGGRYILEIKQWQSRARTKKAMEGSMTEDTPAAGSAGAETNETNSQ
jgi:tetratricopeptide (TPR) repeat protein